MTFDPVSRGAWGARWIAEVSPTATIPQEHKRLTRSRSDRTLGLLFGLMLGDSAVGVVAGVAAGLVIGAIVQAQRGGTRPEKPGV
ncbi:MAG: hypothetical protein WB682_14730 [Candidatus Dormiibacterota bacterium]